MNESSSEQKFKSNIPAHLLDEVSDVIGQARSLSLLAKVESLNKEQISNVKLVIASLSDVELQGVYSLIKKKLSIYPTRSYLISFLKENLSVAKIVLLNCENITPEQENMVVSRFLTSLGVPDIPDTGASRQDFDRFYNTLMDKTEHFGFSIASSHKD